MYQTSHHLHFVGIGGVGMAGIAEVLRNLGYSVSGSDVKNNALIEHLQQSGVRVTLGHTPDNIPDGTTVVVVSSAIRDDNTELVAALARGIPVIPRAEMLAELMRMKYGVAVAGSHGKTTTTTMIAKILGDAGLDPTVIVGGRIMSQRSGARLGAGKYLVAEADESDGSFCLLKPAIGVVTNIDAEHLSHYGSFGELEAAFLNFASSVPFYGLVAACADDPVIQKLLGKLKRRVVTYGFGPGCSISARDVTVEGGRSSFTLLAGGTEHGRVAIPMSGSHMVLNALASIAVALELGVSARQATRSLECFPGVARRSEIVGRARGILVIDDYAHHPTEIAATLRGIRSGYGGGRIIAVFQPHRFTRVRELFSEFLSCFADADEVIVGDIYPAGEEEITGISGEKLASAMQHGKVSFLGDLFEMRRTLLPRLKEGDVVVALGAGSITSAARQLGAALEGRQ